MTHQPTQDARRITHVHKAEIAKGTQYCYRVPYRAPDTASDDPARWPVIEVFAADAEQAQTYAQSTTGCAVGEAVRLHGRQP